MFSAQNFVVTIGNYGAVVALHENKKIKNKIFLEEFNEEVKTELSNLFNKHKVAPIYILLDTVDQSYKKKSYPSIKKSDLSHIIKRDMATDGDKESLKNYIIINNKDKKQINRHECLFVSSSSSEIITNWIEFLLTMPNRLAGIYMLPVEAFNLFKLLRNNIKSLSKIKNKRNDLYCIIVQNKVSGIRQIVFSEHEIVFTRVVNYDFENADFLEKYEQDIYSTFEYLKRLFPDVTMSEIDIVNIFPVNVLEQIKKLDNIELNFINYTPYQAASEIGYADILPQNSNFCDLLISKIFSKEKKILKFTIPKIALLEKYFTILKSSYYANLIILMTICATILYTVISQDKIGEAIEVAQAEKYIASQELTKATTAALEGELTDKDGKQLDIEMVMDYGKIEEALGSFGKKYEKYFYDLKFLKDFDVSLTNFTYTLNGFSTTNPSPNGTSDSLQLNGYIINKSGDIEDLFTEFDVLVSAMKKNFDKNKIKYSELPKNINFNQKYYKFPVDFTIDKN